MRLALTMLVTKESLSELLDQCQNSNDKHAEINLDIPSVDAEVTLEVYVPGDSKNLTYTKNLQRNDWHLLSVATI